MDIKQYDKDNLRNLLIDYIACARFIKGNYEIDRNQRKIINNQVRMANMYIKKLSVDSKYEKMQETLDPSVDEIAERLGIDRHPIEESCGSQTT